MGHTAPSVPSAVAACSMRRLLSLCDQRGKAGTKSPCDPEGNLNAGHPFRPFNQTDVVPVDISQLGELLLGECQLLTSATHNKPEAGSKEHRPHCGRILRGTHSCGLHTAVCSLARWTFRCRILLFGENARPVPPHDA